MTKGVLLRIFMLEGQRHHGELLYDWLLRRAREMGITGGAASARLPVMAATTGCTSSPSSSWRVTCQSKWCLQ